MLFLRPYSSCNQHAKSFFPWSIRHWNKLPSDIVNIKDNDIIKSAVPDHLVMQEEWFQFSIYSSIYFVGWKSYFNTV